MYRITRREEETSAPKLNISKALLNRGFHWDHGDSRGFDVYIARSSAGTLAVKVHTQDDIVEISSDGKTSSVCTQAEFFQRLRRMRPLDEPVPEKLPEAIFDFVIDKGFLFRNEAWRLPNTLLSFVINKYGEVEASYNAEEVGTYSIEEFRNQFDSILGYFSSL